MAALERTSDLADDLSLLASALGMMDLGAESSVTRGMARTRDRLTRSIRSYLIPRLMDTDAPLTVVFAGPTGSGKSTLVNSLSGIEVSDTGPLRPTTKGPVVLASERHAHSFDQISGVECEVAVGRAPILARLALIDTPDIDSTTSENRVMAEILMDNADIVVFVTSALRYADLVPWEVLRRATSRGAPILHVLNRVGSDSAGAGLDFRSRLAREGMDSEILRVSEHHVGPGAHRVPALAVRELQRRLLAMATDMGEAHRHVFNRVLDSTTDQVLELADELEAAIAGARERAEHVRSMFHDAARHVDLTSLCQGLGPSEPPERGLAGMIWKHRRRFGDPEWSAFWQTLRRRLVALVEEDVRQLSLRLSGSAVLASSVAADLRTMTAGAVDSWAGQLGSLAGSVRPTARRLATATLARAATEGRATKAFDTLFADESILPRAYLGLVSRLEVIYDRVGARVAAELGAVSIEPGDTDRLREVTATVVARSQFADA